MHLRLFFFIFVIDMPPPNVLLCCGQFLYFCLVYIFVILLFIIKSTTYPFRLSSHLWTHELGKIKTVVRADTHLNYPYCQQEIYIFFFCQCQKIQLENTNQTTQLTCNVQTHCIYVYDKRNGLPNLYLE